MRTALRQAGRALVRAPRWLAFVLRYALELAHSAVRVAIAVLAPQDRIRAAFVRVPLDATSDGEIALVANLISLTPGTLTVDVEPDHSALIVHAMFAAPEARAALVRSIKETIERPLLALLR